LRADLQDDAMLSVYRNELMQVVLNILKNSEDNFKEKNTQEKYIEIRTYEENGIHTIALADNGGGIPHEIMSKIIIEEHHNGELIAENTSEGVCFTIRLCSNVG